MSSGKEEFARAFAKAILCPQQPAEGCDSCSLCRRIDHGNYEDLYTVSSDERSVKDKQIADIQAGLMNKPSAQGGRNIAIISDADTMTPRAQNRLLKTLEEPAPGTVIMLLSENSDNLLPTIRSRCNSIRLNTYGSAAASSAAASSAADPKREDLARTAKELIDMSVRGEHFFHIKDKLEDSIKDKKTALALLDCIERLAEDRLIARGASNSDRKAASGWVALTEEARRDLAYNVNPKYAIKNLLIKIGG